MTHDDEVDLESDSGIDRRKLLKRAGVGAAMVWASPAIIGTAAAQTPSDEGPPDPTDPCAFGLSENFFGLSSGGNSPGYFTYAGAGTALINGWVTAPGTTGIDACTFGGPFGSQGWANPGPNPPVIIDLAGSPGPGGITVTFTVPCAGDYTIDFQRYATVGTAGDTSLSVTGTGVTPTSTSWGGPSGGVVDDSLTFTTTAPSASVTITFFTNQTGNGNTMVTNVVIS